MALYFSNLSVTATSPKTPSFSGCHRNLHYQYIIYAPFFVCQKQLSHQMTPPTSWFFLSLTSNHSFRSVPLSLDGQIGHWWFSHKKSRVLWLTDIGGLDTITQSAVSDDPWWFSHDIPECCIWRPLVVFTRYSRVLYLTTPGGFHTIFQSDISDDPRWFSHTKPGAL